MQNETLTDILKEARQLDYGFLIIDEIKNNPRVDVTACRQVLDTIIDVETTYSADEIEAGNLLVDIW